MILGTIAANATVPPAKKRESSVRIRLAEECDRDGIKDVIRSHHRRTTFAEHAISEKKLESVVTRAMQRGPNRCVIIAKLHGKIVGGVRVGSARMRASAEARMDSAAILERAGSAGEEGQARREALPKPKRKREMGDSNLNITPVLG